MFFARKKRRPIWQPSKLETLGRAFGSVHISWKRVFAASLLLFLASVVLPELFRPVVLIDPVSIPKLLDEQGFTGQVVAAEIANQTASIEEAIKTKAPKGQLRLASDSGVPDIEVPETKLSMRSVIQLLQVFLHRQPPHVHADIICLAPGCTGLNPAASGDPLSERLEVIYRYTDSKTLFVHKRFRAIDIDDAVTKLSKGILSQVNPYVMARYAYEIDHDTVTALQLLESCANNKDGRLRQWAVNTWGAMLAEQGKPDEAIAKYQQAIELDPKDALPYNNWGNALRAKGKPDEAIVRYLKAIELDPKLALPYYNWGNALVYQGNLDEATAKYRKAIELDPKLVPPYIAWGNALRDQGKLDEAIAKYQKAIELDPKSALSYNNWGASLQRQRKFDEAIAKYQKAIELDPKNALSYNAWGNALLDQGKRDEAMAKYQKAIEVDPKNALPYNGWGNALQHQGKLDEAITKYQKAIELDPKYAIPYNGWGASLQHQGKLDEAIAKYQKAIELDPKYAPAYRNWALILRRQGNSDQAKAKEQKAAELE